MPGIPFTIGLIGLLRDRPIVCASWVQSNFRCNQNVSVRQESELSRFSAKSVNSRIGIAFKMPRETMSSPYLGFLGSLGF
jgi:hypothetical protein